MTGGPFFRFGGKWTAEKSKPSPLKPTDAIPGARLIRKLRVRGGWRGELVRNDTVRWEGIGLDIGV